MATFRYSAALLATLLAGCQHSPTAPAPSTTLAGSWLLTNMQCYCPAGQPLKNEVITFGDSQQFQIFRNDKLAATGTYSLSTGSACGGGAGTQALLTLKASDPTVYAPSGAYTLQGSTLVIDQCLAADGPRYTYTRQ